MSLLQMSFAGAIMIFVIIIIRTLAIHLLPKKTFLVLWRIAAIRLMIPFSLPSALSVYSLLARYTPAASVIKKNVPVKTTGQIADVSSGISNTKFTSVISVEAVIWAVGVLVCGVIFAVVYWKCRQEFRVSVPVNNSFIKNWISTHQQKRKISVRQSNRFSTPLTYGVFCPVILMPETTEWEKPNLLQYILTHEYVHIRRFDSITKLGLIVVLCVHWFNPFVWAMYVLANRDIEMSCDEEVIRLLGEKTKADYARTLISMEETRNGFNRICNNFSKNIIEERITAIMKYKKASIFSLALAFTSIVGVTTVFATSMNTQPQQVESVNPDNETEVTFKPLSIPQISDNFGSFFKEDGKLAGSDISKVQAATEAQSDSIYGVPVEKSSVLGNDIPETNVIYFDTEEERDRHFYALEMNVEKGLDRYAGFESMYTGIDTSAPVTYIVK